MSLAYTPGETALPFPVDVVVPLRVGRVEGVRREDEEGIDIELGVDDEGLGSPETPSAEEDFPLVAAVGFRVRVDISVVGGCG